MEHIIVEFIKGAPTLLVLLIGGLSLFTLGHGADMLVDHAVNISKKFNIPKAIIGATIVSLGTTLPETTVSVMAAASGNPDLALGNAVGSIICDTGMIIGIGALIKPLPVDYKSVKFQSWMQFGTGLLLVILCLPFWHASGVGNISQHMGFVLLGILGVYLYKSMKQSRGMAEELQEEAADEDIKVPIELLLLGIGIGIVIISSKILIPSVEVLAIRAGIPQSIIAATLVAFGTSLPELTTVVKSVQKGHGDLAIGNIMGADILNVLFVVGAAASVTPQGLDVPVDFYHLQLPFMMLILTLFRVFTLNKGKMISRLEGGCLLGLYIFYLVLNYGPAII